LEITDGTDEIAIVGTQNDSILQAILQEYIPHRVIMASKTESSDYPLLLNKKGSAKTSIYLCRNYTCLNPVFSLKELMLLINRAKNSN
jgi:uncharacterized protein YyaL (SSP411 family)